MNRFGVVCGIVLVCGLLLWTAYRGSGGTPPSHDNGGLNAISCPAVGDCVAGGKYADWGSHAYVVSETNGSWGKPIEVRGTADRHGNGDAGVDSISCAAVGYCAAGGHYADRNGNYHVFVVSERHGVWGKAIQAPGTRSGDDTDEFVGVHSISCPTIRYCAAGGYYDTRPWDDHHAFVISERNGHWSKAIEVGPAQGRHAYKEPNGQRIDIDNMVTSVSCAAAGECAATANEFYYDHTYHYFLMDERSGRWGKPIELPVGADMSAVSCAAAGECAAAGSSSVDHGRHFQASVVSETNGVWGDPMVAPGSERLSAGDDAGLGSISCPAVGDCAAAGSYNSADNRHGRAILVSETNGTWGDAIEVPGLSTKSHWDDALSIACGAPGDCAVGGVALEHRYGAKDPPSAFVASETNGVWGTAVEVVPGTVSIKSGAAPGLWFFARSTTVSCAAAGRCVAGGTWGSGPFGLTVAQKQGQAFAVGETNGTWAAPTQVHNFPHVPRPATR